MSEHDIKTFIREAQKPAEKRENMKLWIGVFGFTGVMLTIGAVGGNWQNWRVTTDRRIDKIETKQEEDQARKNEITRYKIDHVTIK